MSLLAKQSDKSLRDAGELDNLVDLLKQARPPGLPFLRPCALHA